MIDLEANNRKLAEWCGYAIKSQPSSRTVFAEDDECQLHPMKEYYEAAFVHAPGCVCPPRVTLGICIAVEVPNFYTSEDASAMLREKLRRLDCQIMMDREGVTVYGPYPDSQSRRPTLVRNEPETLPAIAQAALALMEKEKSNVR